MRRLYYANREDALKAGRLRSQIARIRNRIFVLGNRRFSVEVKLKAIEARRRGEKP